MNDMNHTIEELRHLEAPVTEQEWSSILHDKRYVRKFGRKSGLSPKGRGAIIAGAAAALIAIPILVKTLSHNAPETAQSNVPPTVTETVQTSPAPESTTAIQPSVSTTTTPTTDKAVAPEYNHTVEANVPHSEVITTDNQPITAPQTGEKLATTDIKVRPEKAVIPTPKTEVAQVTQPITPKKVIKEVKSETPSIVNNEEEAPKSTTGSEEPVTESEEFYIPSAFTPNGDGLNDLFYVQANFEPRNFEMTIMTRNGDLLFHSRDMRIGWDGQLHGSTLPHGMYVYYIKYKDKEGKDKKLQGQILLIP